MTQIVLSQLELYLIRVKKVDECVKCLPHSRYKNFHIGTNQEEEVVAAASCCLEKMRVRVFDVAGNLREETAYNGGTGAKLNQQKIW